MHDEIIAANVFIFLVGSGCIEIDNYSGNKSLEHKKSVI